MQITQLTLGEFATNCYVLQGEDKGKCAIIDPADNGNEIQRVVESLHTVPEAILLTHGHFDHLLGVPYLQECWPDLKVYCHRLDCPAETTELYEGVTYPTVSAAGNLNHYAQDDKVDIGGLTVTVLHTPGHTPGSVTLIAGNALFTGDTLFRGDIGRTDFAEGDGLSMTQSLAKLAALPGDYDVLPGHDGMSTLNVERKSNPYLTNSKEQPFPSM